MERLFAEQDGLCFYCGHQTWVRPLGYTGGVSSRVRVAEIEHSTPRHRGGRGDVMACHLCNGKKGRMNVEEFRLWCGLRAGRLPYRFACEPPPPIERDMLALVSAKFVGRLVQHNSEGDLW
jgi:hypothetical protein